MDQDSSPPLSPPKSKRRRLNSPEHEASHALNHEFKIYSWNVNGISPFIQPAITSFFKTKSGTDAGNTVPKASLGDFLRRHKWPTILFLQEVKINPDDVGTIRAVERAVRKQANETSDAFDYEAHFCLPSDKYNASSFGKKVYGVCSILRKDFKDMFVDRIRTVDWDVEGRLLVIETKASKGLPKLGIINIYAVNGTDRPYKDPKTGDIVGTRHDRKLQVHALLQAECRAMEAAGFNVILAGDLNIARTPIDGFPNLRTFPKQHCLNRADFEAKFFSHAVEGASIKGNPSAEANNVAETTTLNMIDTFRHLHSSQKSYTFYPRSKPFGESCDRVDMILVSQTLKDNLKEAGMHETTGDRGPSDHVPLYACFTFDESSGCDSSKAAGYPVYKDAALEGLGQPSENHERIDGR